MNQQATAKKKTAKKAAKHKPKRAVVDELRWAIVDRKGKACVFARDNTKDDVSTWKLSDDRIIRVRITEVTK